MLGKFDLKNDVSRACHSLKISEEQFASLVDINLRTLQYNYECASNFDILDKVYDEIYRSNIRLNFVKSEIYLETLKDGEVLLFHGSKNGIEKLRVEGSRNNCDFGQGLYCSASYTSSLSFIENNPHSSVYVFTLNTKNLSVITLPPSLEWMILVCYYRGMLDRYSNQPLLKKYLQMIEGKDLIIAPIADNRMFQIMRDFGEGNITDLQAIHALSASRLGNQYILKSQRALDNLVLKERLYVSNLERNNSISMTKERKIEIDNKLNLSKREFKDKGSYIDEVFK